MGIEYRLRFTSPNAAGIAEVIRRLPGIREAKPLGIRFELGTANEGWPQATIQIEAGGVYFCDHSGESGRALLGEVTARLISTFGAVSIEEL